MLKRAIALDLTGSMSAGPFNPGDLLDLSETEVVSTAGATTLTAEQVATTILRRSNAGAHADTLPSAAAIIAALQGSLATSGSSLFNGSALTGLAYQNPQLAAPVLSQLASYRLLYINDLAGAATIVVPATSGIVTAGISPLAVAATAWREYLVSILAGGNVNAFTMAGANGAATLTGLTADQCAQIFPGMSVYGTNVGSAARVTGVNGATGTVTVSVVNSGIVAGTVTFTPTVEFRSLRAGTL